MRSRAPLAGCAFAKFGIARLAIPADTVRRNSFRLIVIRSCSSTKTHPGAPSRSSRCKIEAKLGFDAAAWFAFFAEPFSVRFRIWSVLLIFQPSSTNNASHGRHMRIVVMSMTVKALPGSSLEVIETEFFFQLLVSCSQIHLALMAA